MYPVLFVGHGSPMNAIEDNLITKGWKEIALSMPKPKAIVVISAHWETRGTKILDKEDPKTIYDFYGFPKALYEILYKAKSPEALRSKVKGLVVGSTFDDSWGWDHGTWSVLRVMYPDADIPVVQISIDHYATPRTYYEIGQNLKSLRNEGIMILGSGNIVHNLRLASFNIAGGYDWAEKFDCYIDDNIKSWNHEAIINYQSLGEISRLSVPTSEHFNPLLFILGATDENDEISVYNHFQFAGSVSMTSYVFRQKERK